MRGNSRIVGGWCEVSAPDTRFTFVGKGRRPASQSTVHRVVAFHLRGGQSEIDPWKSTPESSHQISITYSIGSRSISLFQSQLEIPDLALCTGDFASAEIAAFVARRLVDCPEPYARFLGLEQRDKYPEVDTDRLGLRSNKVYASRLQYYWASAIEVKLKDIIKSNGVDPWARR